MMNLKSPVLLSLAVAGSGILSQCTSTREDKGPDQQENAPFKNVVVIVSDDHAMKAIHSNDNPVINTPSIDEMAQAGTFFTNPYSNSPISSPSRQSLLTGKYPHATGVSLLFTPFNDTMNTTIAEHLQDYGYHTGRIGKTHFNNWVWYKYYQEGKGMPNHGFDYTIEKGDYSNYLKDHPPKKIPDSIKTFQDLPEDDNSVQKRKNAYTLPINKYYKDAEGTYFTRKAIDYLEKHKNDKFFLWLAYHEPHASFDFPVEYRNSYSPEDITLPEGSPEDDRWIPEEFKGLTDKEKKGIIASYYSCVEYMDRNIGRVLDAVDDKGLAENTLVIYLSDQGYLLYDHKRFEKHMMWEEAIKSPLIFKGGSKLPKGKREDALTSYLDLTPTICEAIGVPPHSEFQGKSFWPVLTNKKEEYRDFVFAEYLEDNKAMVATKRWKYIFTTGKRDLSLGYETGKGPSGVDERLYDLKNDPNEWHNLADDTSKSEILKDMRQKMLSRFMKTHPDADVVPPNLSIKGKLIWFCEPRDVGDEPGQSLNRVFEND